MRLIEKKCPNCGANLEFSETDKSCKCEYCKRSFEIERDNNSSNSIEENYNLINPKVVRNVSFAGGVMSIISIIMAILVFIFIAFVAFNIFKGNSNVLKGGFLYKDISELNNEAYGDFDRNAYEVIYKNDDNLDEFYLDMKVKREKVYIAYKEKENKVITVYKAIYKKRLDNENRYTIYVPIVYENIKNDTFYSVVFQLDNGKVDAPEYYLNLEHSEYTYGYQDMGTLEKELIEPLKKDYKVSEK